MILLNNIFPRIYLCVYKKNVKKEKVYILKALRWEARGTWWSWEALERESKLGRRTARLERRVSRRFNLEEGERRAKPRTKEYTRSNTSCSSTHRISLSERSNDTPVCLFTNENVGFNLRFIFRLRRVRLFYLWRTLRVERRQGKRCWQGSGRRACRRLRVLRVPGLPVCEGRRRGEP